MGSRLRALLSRFRRKKRSIKSDRPLREFVYLDEVSLRSLLSSQKDGVAEGTSNEQTESRGAEGGTLAALGSDLLGKAELSSRFQTSNSSVTHTSRKATVQSWFREFHEIEGMRLLSATETPMRASSLADLKGGAGIAEARLARGELIELKVRLSADPVFRLGTLLTEFLGMAEEFPSSFMTPEAREQMRDVVPMNKILHKLLAGLIPIRAEAVDYVVLEHQGERFVVHRDTANSMRLPSLPLHVVGVTEHQAYWKDIRRVLFSQAEFIVMCRISREGLHKSWTPVKLVDVFGNLVPGLIDQMNAAGHLTAHPRQQVRGPVVDDTMVRTLKIYKALLLKHKQVTINPQEDDDIDNEILLLAGLGGSPKGQRAAFDHVRKLVQRKAKVRYAPAQDLTLREEARRATDLAYLPSPPTARVPQPLPSVPMDFENESRLLDVEVVAIYW